MGQRYLGGFAIAAAILLCAGCSESKPLSGDDFLIADPFDWYRAQFTPESVKILPDGRSIELSLRLQALPGDEPLGRSDVESIYLNRVNVALRVLAGATFTGDCAGEFYCPFVPAVQTPGTTLSHNFSRARPLDAGKERGVWIIVTNYRYKRQLLPGEYCYVTSGRTDDRDRLLVEPTLLKLE